MKLPELWARLPEPLAARLDPGETPRQASHQLIQVPAGQPGLFYSGSSSRLKIVYCHELMITRRLPHHRQTG